MNENERDNLTENEAEEVESGAMDAEESHRYGEFEELRGLIEGVRDMLADGRLTEVLPGYELPQKTMKAVLPRRRETVRRSRQLVEYLRETLGTQCPQRGALRLADE